MKRLFLFVAVVCYVQMVFGQNYRVNHNTYQKVSVTFKPGELEIQNVNIPEGDFTLVTLPDYASSYVPGAPQLPQLARMLEIPVCDSVMVNVVNAEYVDYNAGDLGISHPLFPVQISAAKNQPNPDFAYNREIYNTNAFYALPLVSVEKAGVRRSVALATVHVAPIQYNPVSQIVRVYKRIDVEFTFANADMAQTYALQQLASPLFDLDKGLIINKMHSSRSEFSGVPIKYLIIGNAMFENNEDLEAFVAWKKRLGYLVELVFTNNPQVGSTTTSIQSYIRSHFSNATAENPAPTYVLLLGDREQLPAFSSQIQSENHITDLYYATADNSDYLPDCYYGRLSATNNQQLSNQIEKIMMYEQYTMPEPSYLGNAVLIAGTDDYYGPTHANGQINYVNNYYVKTDNPECNYTNVMVHLYNCSSAASQIRSEVSAGAGLVNYTAHGSETSWADPSFTVSHVAQLQNDGKYGLMIGNCCQSGNFKISECFGEALLRAERKGAMGYIGASNNTYWGEDFYWAVGYRSNVTANPSYNSRFLGAYDKLFHQHDENYDVWVSTIGGMMTAGNMSIQATSSEAKKYYWEIYHCFGDPSVRIFLGVPETVDIVANQTIKVNDSIYTVSALPPYAYVALTQNNEYLAAAFADADGNVTMDLPQDMNVGQCELVVLAQNKVPFFMDVEMIDPEGPYIVPVSFSVAENTKFQAGNTVNLNLVLSNVGISAASGVYATLTPNEPITMLQDSAFVGTISVDGVENRNNAFSFVMPPSRDFAILPFTLKIHWTNKTITRDVKVRVLLPDVKMTNYSTMVNDRVVSNFQPGDQVAFEFNNQNVGHVAVDNGHIDLTCNYSGVKVLTDPSSISGLAPNQTSAKQFNVEIADTVPDLSMVNLYYHTIYGDVHKIDTLPILVGALSDGFESGDLTHLDWTVNNYAWEVTSESAHSGDFSARSARNLPHNQRSRMEISLSTTENSTLSYYRKVSTEENYDFFYLYLDNVKKEEVSGDEDWTLVSLDVPAGNHRIIFSYDKDYSTTGGHDCVYLDDVILPCDVVAVIEDVNDGVDVHAYAEVRTAVYPNPATQWVKVESEEPIGKVVLFDINGRVVKTMNANGDFRYEVSMNDVPTGIYLLQVTFGNNQTRNFKVIKK